MEKLHFACHLNRVSKNIFFPFFIDRYENFNSELPLDSLICSYAFNLVCQKEMLLRAVKQFGII